MLLRVTSRIRLNNSEKDLRRVLPSKVVPISAQCRKFVAACSPQASEVSGSEVMSSIPSLVTTDWLHQRLDDASIRIIDSSWHMPNAKRKPAAEFKQERITGARFFDLDAIVDTASPHPHMLPSTKAFSAACDALRITNETHVVLYDMSGIFSAPRVWWMFRTFGHQRVSVLDGGFPAWSAAGHPISRDGTDDEIRSISAPGEAAQNPPENTSYHAVLQDDLVRNARQVQENISSRQSVVVDARSSGRFTGKSPEPREGIPSGHIPGSHNVPFADVLTSDGSGSAVAKANPDRLCRYRRPEDLQKVFDEAGVDTSQPMIATCGSGVTASVVALAAEQLSKPPPMVSVYDGSWMEWAADDTLPRATGPA